MHESSTSSNFSLIGPPTEELAALERLKNPQRLIMGKMMSPLFLGCSWSDPFYICSMRAWMSLKFGQFQPLVSMVTNRVMMRKTVSPLFLGCFSSDPFHNWRQ